MNRADYNINGEIRAFYPHEDTLRTLFEDAGDPIFLFDSRTAAILDANTAAVQKYGYSLDELRSLCETDITAPPDAGNSKDSPLAATCYHRKKNGGIFPVEIIISNSEQDGMPIRSAVVRDISARIETFENLQKRDGGQKPQKSPPPQNQNQKKSIETATPNPKRLNGSKPAPATGDTVTMFIWRNDEGWPIEFVSDNISVYGYTREDFESEKVLFADFVHPDDLTRVAREVYQFTRDNLKTYFSQEYRIRTKSGEIRWVRDHTFVRFAADDSNTCRYHGVLLDITDYKNTRDRPRENFSQKMQKPQTQGTENINAILNCTAHELNNIFTSIIGNAELVLRNMEDSDGKSESLREIRDAGVAAAELSNKILSCDVAKSGMPKSATVEKPPESANNESEQAKTPAAAPELAEEPLGKLETIEPQPRQKPQLKILEPLSYDQRLIDKGLTNNSALIAPNFLTDALPVDPNQPTAKAFETSLVSPQPFILIPSPSGDKPETVESNLWRGTGTILVAEDEECVCELACKLLRRLGFSVLAASNGQKAVDIFRQNSDKISAVLLDISMPYLNGDKALAEMKRIRSDVKAIVCSGYSRDMTMGLFTDVQPEEFLQKPYQIKELAAKLRKVLEA